MKLIENEEYENIDLIEIDDWLLKSSITILEKQDESNTETKTK